MVFAFTCSEYPSSRSLRRTVSSLARCPSRVSSMAIVAVDLLVQRRKLMGSPAVFSSMICWSAFSNPGSIVSTRGRPAPGFRILSPAGGSSRFRSSRTPFRIVGRDIPVSSFSALRPPRPRTIASLATYQRAWASFRLPSTFNIRSSAGSRVTSR